MEQENKEQVENEQIEKEQTVNQEETMAADDNASADETAQEEDHSRRSRKKRAERQVDELTAKVEDMGRKMAEINDKYMRIYSEYENYRKRTSAEKAGLILNGGKDVIKLMLPIVDDMERAVANMGDGDAAKEGMQLILKKKTMP